jgi:hypothetical protein
MSSSIRRLTPSIQPKQSVSRTDSVQVSEGRPVCFLWNPTTTSVSESWFASSQARNASGLGEEARLYA